MIALVRAIAHGRPEAALAHAGIPSAPHHLRPVHLQAWAELGHRRGDSPITERASGDVLSLLMFAELAMTAIGRIAEVLASPLEPAWPSA